MTCEVAHLPCGTLVKGVEEITRGLLGIGENHDATVVANFRDPCALLDFFPRDTGIPGEERIGLRMIQSLAFNTIRSNKNKTHDVSGVTDTHATKTRGQEKRETVRHQHDPDRDPSGSTYQHYRCQS